MNLVCRALCFLLFVSKLVALRGVFATEIKDVDPVVYPDSTEMHVARDVTGELEDLLTQRSIMAYFICFFSQHLRRWTSSKGCLWPADTLRPGISSGKHIMRLI